MLRENKSKIIRRYKLLHDGTLYVCGCVGFILYMSCMSCMPVVVASRRRSKLSLSQTLAAAPSCSIVQQHPIKPRLLDVHPLHKLSRGRHDDRALRQDGLHVHQPSLQDGTQSSLRLAIVTETKHLHNCFSLSPASELRGPAHGRPSP